MKKEGEEKGSARGSVHWGCYYATALDMRLIPNAAALAAASPSVCLLLQVLECVFSVVFVCLECVFITAVPIICFCKNNKRRIIIKLFARGVVVYYCST